VTVHIPSPLRSYTGKKSTVEAEGSTLDDLLRALDQRYPGFRFRIVTEQEAIRQHIRIFVDEVQERDLSVTLRPDDQIHIICALSGG